MQQEFKTGDVIVESGKPADHLYLIAHGKSNKLGTGQYGDQPALAVLADGDHFGANALVGSEASWPFTVQALTPVIVLALSRQRFHELLSQSAELREHVEDFLSRPRPPENKQGEAAIAVTAGHEGEPSYPEPSSTTRRRRASIRSASPKPFCAFTHASRICTTNR